ncbi:hypothetical protein Taro_023453 [Colocasia esculenta]|uniref:HVA22-like protein n=1 Tax=Colocasia esculenta TaxID=4460 RepID=A0A843V3V0_COLES|nr:hypothetical protein [Colocasia esculenta]
MPRAVAKLHRWTSRPRRTALAAERNAKGCAQTQISHSGRATPTLAGSHGTAATPGGRCSGEPTEEAARFLETTPRSPTKVVAVLLASSCSSLSVRSRSGIESLPAVLRACSSLGLTRWESVVSSRVMCGLALMALGYAYPAYECFKTVEKNKPEIEQLRFWCQYWILVAVLTVLERVGDTFISWLPMYSEAKLAFFIYLWYPKTKGTTYVYETFLKPYVAKHETEIDRNILELRARAGDIAVLYWQKAATYGQTRFVEILQYVASQSPTSRPRPPQQRVRQPPSTAPVRPPAGTQQPQSPKPPRPPPVPVRNQVHDPKPEANPAPVAPPVQNQPTANPSQATNGTSSHLPSGQTDSTQSEASKNSTNEETNPPQETILEESIRVTRNRLRKTRSANVAPPTTGPTSSGGTNH